MLDFSDKLTSDFFPEKSKKDVRCSIRLCIASRDAHIWQPNQRNNVAVVVRLPEISWAWSNPEVTMASIRLISPHLYYNSTSELRILASRQKKYEIHPTLS